MTPCTDAPMVEDRPQKGRARHVCAILAVSVALASCDDSGEGFAGAVDTPNTVPAPTNDVRTDFVPIPIESTPNIVIIMADDLGWNDVGYHGSEIRTPNLDKLAADGVVLDRFYVQPTCSPTRAALMTGKSPLRLGIAAPLSKNNPTGLPIEETTLAERLKARGYQTALVGKWHLGARHRDYLPNARGFDHFYGHTTGGVGFWDKVHGGGYDLQRNGKTTRDDGYLTHLLADEAVDVIQRRDPDQPLFLFASFNAPHLPNEAPEAAIDAYTSIKDDKRRTHAAMVTELDAAIGKLVSTLEDEGMLTNTMIWFMSDNGGLVNVDIVNWLPDWVLGIGLGLRYDVDPSERMLEFMRVNLTQSGSSNLPLQGGKGSLWEGGMRVPSLVHWPGVLAPCKSEQMIAVQDVLPTVLAISSTPVSTGELDGRSVWPALAGGAVLPANDVIVPSGPKPLSAAIYRYPWKLIEYANGDTLLFNVEADPLETNDLSDDQPELAASLQATLQAFPRGENVALPLQDVVDDPDFFGGEEDRTPWAEAVFTD
ncbi:arylsulfatase B [Candidatus Phaeomarinobacter ectocarpi]|uniref:arylsulfatase B n=1 Tax=Candidatus Phaeomarinibacter ectocarpi TaxID=1458461 RepID=UPI0009DFBEA1|nr:arylsulfatase [Candidatus Phaeomarinobacter ectocarpi]